MKAMVCVVCFPLKLSDTWERIDFNLAEITRELFGTRYVETAKIQVSGDKMLPDNGHINTLTHSTFNF